MFILSQNLQVENYSRIAEIFRTALTAQSAQKQQEFKTHFSFYST